jgi:hypothetical protein
VPTELPSAAETTKGSSGNVVYSYKPSLIGSQCQFELKGEGLSWRIAGRSGVWPYSSIAEIRLSYRPISMQSRRYRADIRNDEGQSIAIISVTWQTVALVAPQDDSYREFVTQLHSRIKEADGKPQLSAGLKGPVYSLGVVTISIVGISLLGLFVRAALVASYSGLLFLAGFAALFGWQIGGFMLRNKPRIYKLDALPSDVLP